MRRALRKLLTDTVQHSAFAGRDKQAAPFYGPAVPRSARVDDVHRLVRARDGSQQVTHSMAFIEGPVTVEPEDQIRLPNGTTPPIIAVEHVKDVNGTVDHAEVYF